MPKGGGKRATKGGAKTKGRGKVKGKKGKAAPVQQKKVKRQSVKRTFKKFVFSGFYKPSRRLGQGGVLPRSKALGRLVRWPKYVKLQRQRKVLLQRLVIPAALNLFNEAAPKPLAHGLVKLFSRYKPETRKQKRERLRSQAKLVADGKPAQSKAPVTVKCGFNHVTNLIESGRAQIVLIAHDVDPIELVLWMPTLCVKKDVAFAIVKSKARLGTLVNKKTATCVCLCAVTPDRRENFEALKNQCRERFNERFNYLRRKTGARVLGFKTRNSIVKRRTQRAKEARKKKEAMAVQKAELEEKENK